MKYMILEFSVYVTSSIQEEMSRVRNILNTKGVSFLSINNSVISIGLENRQVDGKDPAWKDCTIEFLFNNVLKEEEKFTVKYSDSYFLINGSEKLLEELAMVGVPNLELDVSPNNKDRKVLNYYIKNLDVLDFYKQQKMEMGYDFKSMTELLGFLQAKHNGELQLSIHGNYLMVKGHHNNISMVKQSLGKNNEIVKLDERSFLIDVLLKDFTHITSSSMTAFIRLTEQQSDEATTHIVDEHNLISKGH